MHRCAYTAVSVVTYHKQSKLHCEVVMPVPFFEQATLTAEVASPSLWEGVDVR